MTTNGTGKGVNALSLLRILNRRKLWLILPVLLLVPAVAFYATRLPQKFRARALVGAEPLIAGQPGFAGRVDPGTLAAQEQLRAIRETLLSPSLLAEVSHEFQWRSTPGSPAPAGSQDDLKSRIEIQVEGADAFYVGFESPDRKQAMEVTNRLAALFVERTSVARGQRVAQQENVLDSEVARLRGELNAREEALKSYKEKVSQDLPERLATNLKEMENLQQQVQAKTDQITEAEARRASIQEEMSALEKQGVLKEEPAPKTPSQVALDDLRFKLNQLQTKYTPEHPEIKRTEKEIHDLEAMAQKPGPAMVRQPSAAQMRYFSLQAELKPIEPRLASYRQERDGLIAQMQEIEKRIDSTPAYETTVSERSRDAAMLRTRYETLFAKQQEAKLNQRTNSNDSGLTFKVLEPATLPESPYSPHPQRIILFGVLAALGLGVAGVFAVERTDTSFETTDEVEEFTTIPVLAAVPRIPTKATKKAHRQALGTHLNAAAMSLPGALPAERAFYQKHRLTVLSDPQCIASQQYGSLAVRLQQKLERCGGRTLVVTSATGQEGKSVTALNLSLAMAATLEGRVLLVDCDLRLPQAQERLGLQTERGFSDLLSESGIDLESYVTRVGSLDVIAGGSKSENPLGLLASQRARDVIAKLKEKYQVVVFDSPPLIPIADSHILAGLADGVVLVVRARKTRRELFRRVVESLEKVNVMGAVLNDVEYAATSYAYAYRYYQRHYLG